MRLFSSFPLVRLPLKRRENGLKLFSPWGRQLRKARNSNEMRVFFLATAKAWGILLTAHQCPLMSKAASGNDEPVMHSHPG